MYFLISCPNIWVRTFDRPIGSKNWQMEIVQVWTRVKELKDLKCNQLSLGGVDPNKYVAVANLDLTVPLKELFLQVCLSNFRLSGWTMSSKNFVFQSQLVVKNFSIFNTNLFLQVIKMSSLCFWFVYFTLDAVYMYANLANFSLSQLLLVT